MNSHKKASLIMLLMLLYLIFISRYLLVGLLLIFPIENVAVVQMLGTTLFFGIPLIVYMIIKKLPLNKVLMLKPLSLKNFFLITFLAIFIQPILNFINYLTSFYIENEVNDALIFLMQGSSFKVLFLAIAIFPAIFEEVVFRGIFIKEYEKSPFWVGIIFSGIFFGMMHLTLIQLIYTTIAGIVIAFLVKVTQSIWAGVLFHFILNGTQVILFYLVMRALTELPTQDKTLLVQNPEVNSNIFILGGFLILMLIFFVLVIFLFMYFLNRFIKLNKENIQMLKQEGIENREDNFKIFNVYFVVCIIVYLIYIIF